jgi:hypothetical protein
MIDHEARLAAYVQLACQSHQKQQALARDRFLWLAAAEACRAGWLPVAQRCRHLGLISNPHHQAAWFDSVPDALRDPDFERVITQYARQCPPERAEHLVNELGLPLHSSDPNQELGDWLLNLLASISIDVSH